MLTLVHDKGYWVVIMMFTKLGIFYIFQLSFLYNSLLMANFVELILYDETFLSISVVAH